MAARGTKKRKGKGGRPKGLAQSPATRKKIKAKMKAYWDSPAGKKRKKAMSKSSGGGRKKTTARKTTVKKAAWSAPKVKARRGRPKGSKNKTTAAAKPAVRKRRAKPMAA